VELISHCHPIAECGGERKLYLSWPKRLHSVVFYLVPFVVFLTDFISVILNSFIGSALSSPVQNGAKDHPVSYIMGVGLFTGVKRPRRGANNPSLPVAEVKGKSRALHDP
jgi:hypothetical protein